ncbi:hypothetical protein D9758_016003 [Tetrapyrgos nigripes]|uniref:Cytochrome P450 n=1 Tax=Tetrapyrgos nigripes TaxID=182062 RepID=A0A8H5FNL1_9AGAR|nr:hypothetical protein D9758_016003 [Tetrapyrgos nigripes]
MDTNQVGLLLVTLILVFIVHRILQYRKLLRSFNSLPGYRTLLPQHSIWGGLLPPIRGVSVGHSHFYENKWKVFEEAGWDAIVNISPFSPLASLELADASAMKQVFQSRALYPKPLELPVYQQLASFGRNIVVSEGEEWKRYRKISGPAFGERNNRLVFTETVKIVNSLFDDVWSQNKNGGMNGGRVVVLEHAPDLTLELSLLVIGSAGFGRPISWSSQHQEFKTTLNRVSEGLLLKLFLNNFQLPRWVWGWVKEGVEGVVDWVVDLARDVGAGGGGGTNGNGNGKTPVHVASTKQVRQAFKDFDWFMREMIDSRRIGSGAAYDGEEGMGMGGRDDLFNLLLDANDAYDDGEGGLEKEKEKEKDGVQGGKLTDEELIGNVFMFLFAGHEVCLRRLILILPSYLNILSARSCIGRKFSETESVVFVAMLVLRYTVEIKPEGDGDEDEELNSNNSSSSRGDKGVRDGEKGRGVRWEDEEKEKERKRKEREERILRAFQGISLVPYRMPLVLRRRED